MAEMMILTNFPRFPENWQSSSGVTGQSMMARSPWEFLQKSKHADIVIINTDGAMMMKLAALYLLFPWCRRPILGNDLLLRTPLTARAKWTRPFKRFLLGRIAHFTLYSRSLEGYQKFFGIGPDRVTCIKYKPDIRFRFEYKVSAEGEYILCFGRSERDYDTFFQAMEKLPDLPAAIPPPNFEAFKKHTSRFSYAVDGLPPNVGIVPDEGGTESLIRIIENAKIVVLPMLSKRIAPAGIGTYLNAMLMGKCVIITHGVGTTDVLDSSQVLLVPPEDPEALARMIRLAWEDKELRERTAETGRIYAESCGGEQELRQRVLDVAVQKLTSDVMNQNNPVIA